MANLYRPRCRLTLILPVLGSTRDKRSQSETDQSFEVDVNISRASWTQNDHNHADELEVEIPYQQAGVDPRFLKNACCRFYLNDIGESGAGFTRSLRFAGIAVEPARILTQDEKTVRIKFHDYTSLFLRSKPFPKDGIPAFSSTLLAAWQQICDHTGFYSIDDKKIVSSVASLRDRIVFEGNAKPDTVIGTAVAATRLAKVGKIDPGLNKNAWDVWQHVCGSVGLISFMRRDQCVVTDAKALYTSVTTPVFIWAENILKLTEKVDTGRGSKFICLVSIDPLTGAVVEAFWPPRGEQTGVDKQKQPRKTKKPVAGGGLRDVNEYEIHEYPYGVTNQAVLTACAERVYEERSRQELTGELTTREMAIPTTKSGISMDVLAIASGDVIQVRVDPDVLRDLKGLKTAGQRIAYLRDERAYSDTVARLIVANVDGLGSLPPNFMVRSVHTELAFEESGGTFDVQIQFCNRIQEDGSANVT